MEFEFDLPETLPSNNKVQEPGFYHCVVTEIDEQPRDKNNALMEGFKPTFEVLDGTARVNNVCTQRGFTHEQILFSPKPGQSEGGIKWSKAKQAAFLLATGLVNKDHLGKSVKINLADALQKQVVINLVPKNDDSGYLEIAWANIYAVDDPKVAAVPKDVAALRLIGKESAAAPAANATAAAAKPAAKASTSARNTAANPALTPDPNNANAARGQTSTSPSGATTNATVAAGGDWKL